MPADFEPVLWDDRLVADCHDLVGFALREDLGAPGDLTSNCLIAENRSGRARFMARESGIACGLSVAEVVRTVAEASFTWRPETEDGDPVEPGQCLATIEGPARELLTYERTILNFMGRLSGIATLAHQFVQATAGSKAKVYDTRKTTPGWRRLEKYAVRSGGAQNHRLGLFDAVMIKDNHLVLSGEEGRPLSAVVQSIRQQLNSACPIEIEVDTLKQLEDALLGNPDIVLLDNMTTSELREAVKIRDRDAPQVVLEASGGVNLDTIGPIAKTGVDRISVGALTHSARALDLGLDWEG